MPKVKTYHFKTSTPRQFIGRNYKLKVSEKSLKNETFWRFLNLQNIYYIHNKYFKKYVGVQSWKAAHLPTLEIRVE